MRKAVSLGLSLLLVFTPLNGYPQATGEIRYNSNVLEFFDGTDWQAMDNGDTGVACGTTGEMRYNTTPNPDRMEFCNGSTWHRMDATVTADTCSTAGEIEYFGADDMIRFCNGANWVETVAGLVCPANYVVVPADGTYTTEDFCVAKYEMKNVSGVATSQAASTPWVNINRATAITECTDLGDGYDLITNSQWQTIARNIENVGANWQTGVVGGTQINHGHADGVPAGLLAANSDDNVACSGTGQTCDASTWNAERRTNYLSNGEVIWDLGANAGEWVKDNSSFNYGIETYISLVTAAYGNTGPLGKPKVAFGPAGDYSALNTGNRGGLGHGWFSGTDGALTRGGFATDTTFTGIFTVAVLFPTDTSGDLSFRCVYAPPDPNLPDAFDFPDVYGAALSTSYNVAAVVTGFQTDPLTASVSGGDAQVRKNGTGAWGSSVDLSPGDILNLRMTSSGSASTAITATVTVGSLVVDWVVSTATGQDFHYFVLTSAATSSGNLGGLSGANATCLSDLQANDWLGKSNVNLDSNTVKAFLCDGSTCNNLVANEAYAFATSGNATSGGATFTTNGSGQGPGDASNWSGATFFNDTGNFWTGRASSSATLWANTSDTNHCSGWTSTATNGRRGALNAADATRWTHGTVSACTSAVRRLICAVDYTQGIDTTPNTFDFLDVEDAQVSTQYEESTVVLGFVGPLNASVSGGGAQIRVNNTGSWVTSGLVVNPGDTLNIRMTSSASYVTGVTATVTLGTANVDWLITTLDPYQTIFLTSGTSWTVPVDWNNSDNTIEVIGGGGGGGSAISGGGDGSGSGGGGGAYSKATNVTMPTGTNVTIAVGSGGAAATAGGDTYVCNSTSNCGTIAGTAVVAGAKGGGGGGNEGGAIGAGGASASGKPSSGGVRRSGGNGGLGRVEQMGGGGGGGAAGPSANGAVGGSPVQACGSAGGGGGGANGGTNGGSPASGNETGGNGGNGPGGSGGGAGGNGPTANGNVGGNGSNGGGGGGGSGNCSGGNGAPGGTGGNGTEWDATHGAGGGGGGGGNGETDSTPNHGGIGGGYGGGGGGGGDGGTGTGGTGGTGSQGIIVIKYFPDTDGTPNAFDFTDVSDATKSTQYTDSAIVGGFGGSLTASVSGGGAEIRKNGTGSWVTSGLSVNPGDTINIRMTASGSPVTPVTATVTLGSVNADWTVTTGTSGNYFVLTNGVMPNGNLGGLAGANATCLSDLQAGAWLGKSNVTLNASTVKAWLCNGTTCNNTLANTTYTFARSGSATAGGATFTTNGSGVGPGDSANWNGATYFNGNFFYWTGRGPNSGTLWGTTSSTAHCSGWTTTSGNGEEAQSNATNGNRWYLGAFTCSTNTERLICLVDDP